MNNVRAVQWRYPLAFFWALSICFLGLFVSGVPARGQGGIVFAGSGPQPPPADLGPGQTFFADNFQTLDTSWGGPADSNSFVQNGTFELNAPAGKEVSRYSSKYFYFVVDVAATVVAQPGTQPNSSAGLIVWSDGDDNDNEIQFLISPLQGTFALYNIVGGKATTIVDWQYAPSLNVGVGKVNRFEVIAGAKQGIFLINGHQVAQMAAPATSGGIVGLTDASYDTNPADYAFSNFLTKVPSTSALPPGTVAAPAAAAGQTIFSDDFKTLDPSWGVPNTVSSVAGGRLELRSPTQAAITLLNNKYAYKQAAVEVSAVEAAGSVQDSYLGLLFWGADVEDYVIFGINPAAGAFGVFQVNELNDPPPLINWQNTNYLDTGAGKTNRLGVVFQAGKAVFLINGHQVGQIAAPSSLPGQLIGLFAMGGEKGPGNFDFSDFKAVAPNSDGSAPGLTQAPPVAASPTNASGSSLPATPFTGQGSAPAPAGASPTSASGSSLPATPFTGQGSAPAPAGVAADLAPPAPLAPGPGETLAFSDDFKSYGPSWGAPDSSMFVQNGRMVAQLPGAGFGVRMNGAYRYYDADISFAGRVVKGPAQSGIELVFWMQDNQHYYYLVIDAAGHFEVRSFSGTTVSTVAPMQASPAIKTGLGQWNMVELSTRGGVATLLINGAQVVQFAGTPPADGGAFGLVGVGVGPGPSTMEFANLRVAVPTPVRLTRGWAIIEPLSPVAAAPGATWTDDFRTFDPSWGLPTGLITITDGALLEQAQDGGPAGIMSDKYLFTNADISVNVDLVETAQNDSVASLYFWNDANLTDGYFLSISPLGYFRVAHLANGKDVDVIKWQGAAAIRQGVGQSNEVGLSLRGGKSSILINGQTVGQFSATPPVNGGIVGLSMLASKAGSSSWQFSKLSVTAAGRARAQSP